MSNHEEDEEHIWWKYLRNIQNQHSIKQIKQARAGNVPVVFVFKRSLWRYKFARLMERMSKWFAMFLAWEGVRAIFQFILKG